MKELIEAGVPLPIARVVLTAHPENSLEAKMRRHTLAMKLLVQINQELIGLYGREYAEQAKTIMTRVLDQALAYQQREEMAV